jgi:hypothetical protein
MHSFMLASDTNFTLDPVVRGLVARNGVVGNALARIVNGNNATYSLTIQAVEWSDEGFFSATPTEGPVVHWLPPAAARHSASHGCSWVGPAHGPTTNGTGCCFAADAPTPPPPLAGWVPAPVPPPGKPWVVHWSLDKNLKIGYSQCSAELGNTSESLMLSNKESTRAALYPSQVTTSCFNVTECVATCPFLAAWKDSPGPCDTTPHWDRINCTLRIECALVPPSFLSGTLVGLQIRSYAKGPIGYREHDLGCVRAGNQSGEVVHGSRECSMIELPVGEIGEATCALLRQRGCADCCTRLQCCFSE